MNERFLPAWRWLLASIVLAVTLSGGKVLAHQGNHEAGEAGEKGEPATSAISPAGTRDAKAYFTDTELLTQDGQPVRFYSDVLQDRVVLINVIYTSCEDACPLITQKLKEVRQRLEERVGKEVWFVSISSDPKRDSPQALKKFAREQGVDEQRWVFLTGTEPNVSQVLTRLGQLARTAEEHSTLLIAGNVAAKRWSKVRPDAPVIAIAERLKVLVGAP